MKASLWYNLLAACAVSLSFAGQVAYASPAMPAHRHTMAKMGYVCPKCHVLSAAAGKCPYCKVALVKSHGAKAKYECAMCGIKGTMAGKCPKCGMAMTRLGSKSHKM